MSEQEKKVPGEFTLKFELPPDVRNGIYSNFVRIQHSTFDFLMDFGKVLPDENKILVGARVYMSPQHIKLFAAALQSNIQRYEEQFGPIPAPKNVNPVLPTEYSKH